MVNAPKKNFSQLLAAKYGKSTKQSTWQCHQVNEGKRGLEASRVRTLWALRSWQSKKKLAAEKQCETHFLSNEEKEQWIEVYIEKESAVERKRVEDAEAAIRQTQEETGTAENAELMTREPDMMSEEVIVAIGESLSHLASSDDGEDGDDEDDGVTKHRKLSEGDEP